MPRLSGLTLGAVTLFAAAALQAQDAATNPKIPKLVSPLDKAEMDNGRTDRKGLRSWTFEWTPIAGAEGYQIEVYPGVADRPSIDRKSETAKFVDVSRSYIIERNAKGWRWRVRARIDGVWADWSPFRTFDVEPVDTDAPEDDETLATAARVPDDEEAGGPKLTSPKHRAVMDNGRTDRTDQLHWEFEWEPVAGAEAYEIMVKGFMAKIPLVNVVTKETKFVKSSLGDYIIPTNGENWTWRVRAKVGGEWKAWSSRKFDVERVNTDPPLPGLEGR